MKFNLNEYHKIRHFLNDIGYDELEIKSIYESYFKFITGIDFSPLTWMNYFFDSPSTYIIDDNNIVLKSDTIFIGHYNLSERIMWFNYDNIFLPLFSYLDCENSVKDILKEWLKNCSIFDHSVLSINFTSFY
jgi:hypothetical protein